MKYGSEERKEVKLFFFKLNYGGSGDWLKKDKGLC